VISEPIQQRRGHLGVVSENGKKRTLSLWHGRFAHKRSFFEKSP